MKKLHLARIGILLLDDLDYEKIIHHQWFWDSEARVIQSTIDGSTTSIGRFILKYNGHLDVDHINGNPLDNQKSNLRLATRQQNIANTGPRGFKNFKGTYYDKRRNHWTAAITVNYKRMHIGCYITEELAAKAYDIKALKHFGEFAYLNFPEK